MSTIVTCPANPDHGPLLGMKGGLLYCPHADHDIFVAGKRISPFFSPDNLVSEPTPTRPVKVKIVEEPEEEAKRIFKEKIGSEPKTCTICSGTYLPGQYSQHKILETHVKMLSVNRGV